MNNNTLGIANILSETPVEVSTGRDRGYFRNQRKRVIRRRSAVMLLKGLEKEPGRFAKSTPLADRYSHNPRRKFKGKRALTLQERRQEAA